MLPRHEQLPERISDLQATAQHAGLFHSQAPDHPLSLCLVSATALQLFRCVTVHGSLHVTSQCLSVSVSEAREADDHIPFLRATQPIITNGVA